MHLSVKNVFRMWMGSGLDGRTGQRALRPVMQERNPGRGHVWVDLEVDANVQEMLIKMTSVLKWIAIQKVSKSNKTINKT
jgi:hypothetical protein